MILTRPQALGMHAYFAAEGAAYATGYNGGLNNGAGGNVDVNDPPATNDPAFIFVGTIEDWTHKPTPKEVKTLTPAPGILVPKRTVTVSQEMAYNFTTNELTPMALGIFYRVSQALVQASTQMNPLSGKPPHGFLLLQGFSTEGDQVNPYMVALLWVFLKITGGVDGGENKIIKPTFEADQMFSPWNSISLPQAS